MRRLVLPTTESTWVPSGNFSPVGSEKISVGDCRKVSEEAPLWEPPLKDRLPSKPNAAPSLILKYCWSQIEHWSDHP